MGEGRTLRTTINTFQMYNVLLLTIVTTLCVRALEFIHIIIGSLYALTNLPLPAFHSLLLWVQLFSGLYIEMSPCLICLSVSVFSDWAQCRPGSCMWLQLIGGPPSSKLRNTALCLYTFSYLVTYPWTLRLFPSLAYHDSRCNEVGGAGISLWQWFYFLGVCIQKWDCWTTW